MRNGLGEGTPDIHNVTTPHPPALPQVLMQRFHLASPETQAVLLSAITKICVFPGKAGTSPATQAEVRGLLQRLSHTAHPELQQRAVEYLKLLVRAGLSGVGVNLLSQPGCLVTARSPFSPCARLLSSMSNLPLTPLLPLLHPVRYHPQSDPSGQRAQTVLATMPRFPPRESFLLRRVAARGAPSPADADAAAQGEQRCEVDMRVQHVDGTWYLAIDRH